MAVSNDFLEYVLDQLSFWDGVYTKKMFGGVGLYFDGLMFGLVYNDMISLKVDTTNKEKYIQEGMEPIKVFKTETPIPSFYIVPIDVFENKDVFTLWAKESFAIQIARNT